MDIIDERLAVIQPLSKFWYEGKVAGIDVLRLDLLHPVISGNKWYKLRLNLGYALDNGFKKVVTLGGGYSNHLVATACAAKRFGLTSVGIVRGDESLMTPTLQQCRDFGMELKFVSREDYTNRHDTQWVISLTGNSSDTYYVPEGGANERGRAGAGLLTRFVNPTYTHIALAVGTGTTLAGLRGKLATDQQVLGYVPMKKCVEQEQYISSFVAPDKQKPWRLIPDSNFGGFGKWNNKLTDFMNDFHRENSIPLDLIYTGKMMYLLNQALQNNEFSTCDRILCIHSGGLQGNTTVKQLLTY